MPSGLSLPAGPGVPGTFPGATVLLAMLVEMGGVEASAFTTVKKLERLVCGVYWVILC